MAKQKTMLDHMIDNLTPGQIAELTDFAQDRFPDVAATFAQQEMNRREAWITGLMAEHTWRRKVPYQEFCDAFHVGALTDTYGDARCRQALKINLDICCPGWSLVTEQGSVNIHFPSLDDVRASCEKRFGKISWRKTDEEAMIPIQAAEVLEAAKKEKEKAHGAAMVKFAMEWREAVLPTMHRVTNRERELNTCRAEAESETFVNAKKALAEAEKAHEMAKWNADSRQQAQIQRLKEEGST